MNTIHAETLVTDVRSGISYSICGLPATYTITYGIDDISLIGLWIVHCESRWLGNAESMDEARMVARLHYSLLGGVTLH